MLKNVKLKVHTLDHANLILDRLCHVNNRDRSDFIKYRDPSFVPKHIYIDDEVRYFSTRKLSDKDFDELPMEEITLDDLFTKKALIDYELKNSQTCTLNIDDKCVTFGGTVVELEDLENIIETLRKPND